MITALRSNVLKAATPLLAWVGKQHIPYSKKRLKFIDAQNVLFHVKPGDVILTRTRGEMTNWFIPGTYKHAAMYFGDGYFVEATGSGVTSAHANDFVMTKDYCMIVRPLFANTYEAELAADWAWMQRGRPYDYEFKSGNESFYCFELTYAAYNEVLKYRNPWTLRTRFGEPTIVAEDFLKATTKWGEVLCL